MDTFEKLLNTVSSKLGTNPEKLKEAAKSGNIQKALGALGENEAKQVKKILNDKTATAKLLSSPQAQEILKKIMGS